MSKPPQNSPVRAPFWAASLWAAACLGLASTSAHATITPAPLFTDNAVLQRQQPVPVWGTAESGEQVSVAFNGQTARATADGEGNWSLQLKPLQAGGPYTLAFTGSKSEAVTLKNILVGEVWLCSGQSNMEYPLTGMNPAAPTKALIPTINDPQLRFVMVARTLAYTPQTRVGAQWKEANPDTVAPLSAVSYFFARDLRRSLNVPVGIVESAFGGTFGQNWMSREALASQPSLSPYLDEEASYATVTYPKLLKEYNDKLVELQPKYDADKAAYDAAKLAGTTPLPPRPALPRAPQPPDQWQAAPTRLFNGMIAPLIPYAIRGATWYQGEGNWNKGYEYQTLLPTLIADWRDRWHQGNFPFYIVQLPPNGNVNPLPEKSWLAEVREAQRLTAQNVPNAGLVVTTDVGDQKDIHPFRKEQVGARLALLARANVYGEKIEFSGPVFDGLTIEGNQIRVKFSHAKGLRTAQITDHLDDGPVLAPADQVMGFTVAGADGIFANASAKIEGISVVLSAPEVAAPVAVRYGWSQFPLANLQNEAGLWASPFRTDDQRFISQPRTPIAPAVAKPIVPAPAVATTAMPLVVPKIAVAPPQGAAPTATEGEAILNNGDFEQGLNDWTVQEKVPMTQVLPEAARTGKMGIRIVDEDEKLGSSAFSRPIQIKSEQGYRLSFWAKTATEDASIVALWFASTGGKGIPEYMPATLIKKSDDFAQYQLLVRAPISAGSMKIWIHSNSGPKVTVDLDDFSLEKVSGREVDALPVPVPATAPLEARTRKSPPYIILKLDDMVSWGPNPIPAWTKLTDFVQERKIKASIGIICKSLEGDKPAYFNWIKDLNKTGLFEFWNHGYQHREWKENDKTYWDFYGPTYEQQKQDMQRSEELAREKLGFPLATFGPPYGYTDTNTVKVLRETPDLKIWLYGDTKDLAGKIDLNRVSEVNIENPLFTPSLDKFIAGYNQYPNRDYFVIQGHAAQWDDARFVEFTKIIDFLTEQKAIFITPSEYVALKNLKP